MALLSDDTKKKLKVAMTTKLEEMGVQVEKELPDYVLSMISNNKDRSYIARNLSVFMGDNSRFFSDWLHNLVERIVMQQRPAPVTAVKVDENAREKAAKLDEEAKRRKRRSDTTPPSRKAEGKSPEKKAAQQRDDDSRRGRSSRNKSRRGRSRSRSRSCEPMETNQPAKHVVSTVIRRQLSPDNRRVLSSVTVKRRLPDKSSQPRPAIFSRAIKDVLEHDGFGKNNIVRVDLEASYGESPERPVTVRLDKKLDNGDYGFCKKFARKIVIEDDDDKAEPKKLSDAGKDEGSRVFHVTPVQIVDSLHNLSQSSSNIKTRCKFWPGCDREGCTYIHPTKECTTFPHCRFGADCVYIHPPCRYANLCYNNACTYTHAKIELLDKLVQEMAERKEKRSSQTTMEVPLTMCHFAGRCKSQTCEYRHPPACRYSERCKNPQCHFYHGPLGNIQQHYSWRAMA